MERICDVVGIGPGSEGLDKPFVQDAGGVRQSGAPGESTGRWDAAPLLSSAGTSKAPAGKGAEGKVGPIEHEEE